MAANENKPDTTVEQKTIYVEETKVSGAEAKDWLTKTYTDRVTKCEEIYISDYLGEKDHVIIPVEIDGRKIAGLSGFQIFRECKAKVVEIPGYFRKIPSNFASWNKNITTVIIGEGIDTIEDFAFVEASNLEKVMISKSLRKVGDRVFEKTKWYDNQKDYVIMGTILFRYKGHGKVLRVPNGITTIATHVLESYNQVRKVVLPHTVTTLCKDAFSSLNIEEFVFTDSLTNIGVDSFGWNNKWIKSFGNQPIIVNNQLYRWETRSRHLSIPEGVVRVCDEVFYNNGWIQSVVFPSTIKSIGRLAFCGCRKLGEIIFLGGLERLDESCFSCSGIRSITLPNTIKTIGENAFNRCTLLETASLAQVEVIGKGAFSDCQSLQSLTVGERIHSIPSEAFKNCSSLQQIDLPESVVEIGSDAFNGCKALREIHIPGKVKTISHSALRDCKALREVAFGDNIETIEGYAFAGCEQLRKIKLPKMVGESAFSGCHGLIEALLHPQTIVIEAGVFHECSELTEIIIPQTVTQIGRSAFYGCEKLKGITFPPELTMIGEYAFSSCTTLEKIVIPDSVKTIGDNAFMDCTSLSDVSLPDTVESVGLDAFTNTPYMKKTFGDFMIKDGVLNKYLGSETEVIIPDSVETIAENAFAEARYVEIIRMPDTLKTIANRIFGKVYDFDEDEQIPQLTRVFFGNGVTTIGEGAFAGCQKLIEAEFGTGLISIGENAFEDCKALRQINLSKTTIKIIPPRAFSGCGSVNKLVFPEGIEIIDQRAFSGVPLGVVKLPKTVKKVERSAFDATSELIVYDTLEPDAVVASEWKYDEWNGSVNALLSCAMLNVMQGYAECQGNTRWRDYHITVLSAETNTIRYRIFCDSKEPDVYRAMMFSVWGKNASFAFEPYDDYFMKARNMLGRTEMAFCRMQYPEGLSTAHRADYEAFLERCLYIERSARRTAEMIGDEDAVERLALLDKYHAIDDHNIHWIREIMNNKNAKKCQEYLKVHFSK